MTEKKKLVQVSELCTTNPDAVTSITPHVAEISLLHLQPFTNSPFHFHTSAEPATSQVFLQIFKTLKLSNLL